MNIVPDGHRRSALVLMCGRSFSGKSTVGREIATAIDADVVSLDAINEERGLFGGQGIPVEEWMRTNEEASRRVLAALNTGNRVVVDDTSSPRFLRDGWRSLAAGAGAAFALVYVDTPERVIRERLAKNREQLDRHDVRDEVMAAHLETFEPPETDEEHFVTSSSSGELPRLISAIRERITEGGLRTSGGSRA